MTTLDELLCLRLGELLYQHEHTYDYFEKVKIDKTIQSINMLLDVSLQPNNNSPFKRWVK